MEDHVICVTSHEVTQIIRTWHRSPR